MNYPSPVFSRREALSKMACGVGGIALASLLAEEGALGGEAAGSAVGPHHAPKAKSLIFLNMQGGPSQFETFDFKPEMHKWAGKEPPPISDPKKAGVVRFNPGSTILPPLFKYVQKGQSGLATTEIFPHMADVLDELCVVRSMTCDSPAHPGGQTQAMTGYARRGMPSIGSWILYGLGSANEDLPGYVYLAEGYNHHSGFLPAETQGMPVGAKVPNLKRPGTMTEPQQRQLLDELAKINGRFAEAHPEDGALSARIEAAELAFRMQMSCPDAVDLSTESAATLKLYGLEEGRKMEKPASRSLSYTPQDFATMCLVARRLVQRGVRVVTVCVGGRRGWDQHSKLKDSIVHNAKVIDQAMAALITDLKSHGLLDSTLIMWGGEFGRTPFAQSGDGRDHFAKGYTYWLCGGGSKPGTMYGKTDEVGQEILENPVHIHDMHATVLHLMGLNPEKLTFRHGGRDHRLTDTNGKIVPGLIA